MSGDDAQQQAGGDERPLLRIVRGIPDDVELAALTGVVAALGGSEPAAPAPRRSQWGSRAALHRRPLTPGPGAWRAAAR